MTQPHAEKILSRDQFARTRYFPALDALRGAAILLVLFHHSSIDLPGLNILKENGRYGVHLFFVISGFIICTQLLRSIPITPAVLGRFYLRRLIRLTPLYYLALGCEAAIIVFFDLYSPQNEALFVDKLPSYLTYTSNWHPQATQGPFFQAWSLAVEEQFYLLFGLAVFLVPVRTWMLFCAVAIMLKIILFSSPLPVWNAPWWRVLFSYHESILLGVLLACAMRVRPFFDFALFLTHTRHLVLLVSLSSLALLAFALFPHSSRADALVIYIAFAFVAFVSVLRPDLPLLSNSALIFLGRASYVIYLFHMFFLNAASRIFAQSPVAAFLIASIALFLFAACVHKFVERPIQSFYRARFSEADTVSTPN